FERRAKSSVRDHPLLISVWNGPHMMQLTRTLGPYSLASATVRIFSPALAEAYGAVSGSGRIAAVEETLIIEPPSPAAIREPNSADRRTAPLRLTPMILSNNSSLVSTDEGASGEIPALLISTSARPQRA